jgi:hypothetical protein
VSPSPKGTLSMGRCFVGRRQYSRAMGSVRPKAAAEERGGAASFGVLVGWTHREFNGRLNLQLQTIQSTRLASPDDADAHHFILTKNQAAVLANYLYQVSGQTPPRPHRRSWLKRVFGR